MFLLLKDVDVMELTNKVYEAINKYFSVLSHTGYKSYNEVYKLLAFIFIEEMLYGPLSQFITEDDYNEIDKALDCIYGSCMIPYPDYKRTYDSVTNKPNNEYRITESSIYRDTENLRLRVKS